MFSKKKKKIKFPSQSSLCKKKINPFGVKKKLSKIYSRNFFIYIFFLECPEKLCSTNFSKKIDKSFMHTFQKINQHNKNMI